MRRAGKSGIFSKIYLAFIVALMYIPVILTVIYSFNAKKSPTVWGGFSMKWYEELAGDRSIREALGNSLLLAFGSCFFAILIGTSGALGMRGRQSKFDGVIAYLSTLPIMIPEIILGMVFLGVFSFMNLPFGMVTLMIAHTAFCIPYVFMMVRARLEGMDKNLEEAALDLGARPFAVFRDITFPAILPAILSGALLSFAMSFDDVVISIFVTGARTNTLAIKIYTKLKTGVTPEINALATILLIVTAAVILLSRGIGRHKEKSQEIETP